MLNSPVFEIIGDTLPCRDSAVAYIIQPSDHYTTWDFDTYGSASGVVATPADGQNIGYVSVDFSGEFVLLNITQIQHEYCSNFSAIPDVSVRIKSDTTPNIPFVIEGPNYVCMGDVVEFIAVKDASVNFDVSFVWEIHYLSEASALEPWDEPIPGQTVLGAEQDTLRVTSAYYDKINQYVDTIVVYAKGSCGTVKLPKTHTVLLDTVPVFDAPMYRSGGDPICEDSLVRVWVDTTGLTDIASIRWRYLDESFLGGDTIDILMAKADQQSAQNTLTVSTYFLQEDRCGYSKPNSITINIHNQPQKPAPLQNPYPCKDEEFALTVPFDEWTEQIAWQIPDPNIVYSVFNSKGVDFDSLYIEDVFQTPFDVIVEAMNMCGVKKDTVHLQPINNLTDLLSENLNNFDDLRYCEGDTVVGYLEIPDDHVVALPSYHWTLPDDWIYITDSTKIEDSINKIWFIPGQASGPAGGCRRGRWQHERSRPLCQ